MKKKLASSVYTSGKIVEKGAYFFSARLDIMADGDYDHAVISACKDGKFFFQERDMQVESVCIRRETRSEPIRDSCVLPRFNTVVGFYQKGGKVHDEGLPSSHLSGVMGQLRFIDGVLYAAGSGGCIFKRISENNWLTINAGLKIKSAADYKKEGHAWSEALDLAENQVDTTTINGRNGKIISAGHRGEVFFLKGERWESVESQTNSTLRDIAVSDAGVFYICGRNGTLIVGDERGFSPIPTNIDDYFNSMAFFNGELYIGGANGLYKLTGNSVQPVRTNQSAPFNCVELDAYDGELLAVSDRWFLVFDGANWRRIDDPDNADVLRRQ